MFSQDISWAQVLSDFHLTGLDIFNIKSLKYTLAFSGGPDSCLSLFFLLQLSKRLKQRPHLDIIYIEHGQNLDTVNRAQLMSSVQRKLAKVNYITYEFRSYEPPIQRFQKKLNTSFEYTAARLRKRIIHRENAKNNVGITVWGHTLSDWFETLIMRLNRGAGLESLMPFSLLEQFLGRWELRPLYLLSRNEVRSLCEKYEILYWNDPSNLDRSILRNEVRDQFSIMNVDGLRSSALNFLQVKRIKTQAREVLINNYQNKITKINNRELRIEKFYMNNINQEQQTTILIHCLNKLGMHVTRFQFQKFFDYNKTEFRYKCYVIEIENWANKLYVIIRRGNWLLQLVTPGFVRVNTLTKSFTIQMKYGKKSITKILSENKLSSRQRYNALAKINKESKSVQFLSLQIFNLENISAYGCKPLGPS